MSLFLKRSQGVSCSYLLLCLIGITLCCSANYLQAQEMEISINETSLTLLSGDSIAISVDYSLELPSGETANISLQNRVSDANDFYTDLTGATGDIGENISAGANKNILWEGPLEGNVFDLVLHANQDIEGDIINEILSQVDSTRMREDLVNVEGIRHRTTGIEKLEATQTLIRERLQGYNIPVSEQTFPFGVGYDAVNFIGRQNGCGRSEDVWLIGGHYDTVDDSPGADDNGTAIVGMLEAARVLSAYQFEKSIAFVAWDLEEEGLVGSTDFVTKNQDSFGNMEGYMNFEMIGYFSNRPNTQTFPAGFDQLFPAQQQAVADDAFRGNFIANVGNTQNSLALMQSFETMANQYVPELKVISIPTPGTGALVPDLRRSDHTPFWLANIPAIMITDSANFRNENYHGPEDVLDSLSFTFMANVVKATLATVIEDAQPTRCVSDNTLVTVPSNSTKQVIDNSALIISPNPARNQITLSLKGVSSFINMEVLIYSADGQLALNQNLKNNDTITLGNLGEGLYHVLVVSKDKSYSSTFIIQR